MTKAQGPTKGDMNILQRITVPACEISSGRFSWLMDSVATTLQELCLWERGRVRKESAPSHS